MNILTEKLSIFTIQKTPLFTKILMVFLFTNRQTFKSISYISKHDYKDESANN